ncbi:hypothetical protein NK718_04825 [Alsobacter sp. SYSU M60028]|uniref:Uncharacterized protein n=1 Tax=Alsobacter ponti TaxID=2962936 RepID=A0ABT1L8M5_9HYPH|nr:hypothetical protein [Alsobacter ponti]MCP8937829.1 hypothetical protein [Alsobacter ponti]
MSATQIHIVDAAAGLILVVCSDGSRVLFGSHVGLGTPNEAVQRIFEILEDGAIDYFIHECAEPQGVPVIDALVEFFPVKMCLERTGADVDAPQFYRNIRGERRVETLDASEIYELGETQLRILQAEAARPGRPHRPVALHVMHGEGRLASSAMCCGATSGLDWRDIAATDPDLQAACMIVHGSRPLDVVLTARDLGIASAEPLRAIAPSTVVLGADPGGATSLRGAARELYSHFARGNGAGLVELTRAAWTTLVLDGDGVRIEREDRPMTKVA